MSLRNEIYLFWLQNDTEHAGDYCRKPAAHVRCTPRARTSWARRPCRRPRRCQPPPCLSRAGPPRPHPAVQRAALPARRAQGFLHRPGPVAAGPRVRAHRTCAPPDGSFIGRALDRLHESWLGTDPGKGRVGSGHTLRLSACAASAPRASSSAAAPPAASRPSARAPAPPAAGRAARQRRASRSPCAAAASGNAAARRRSAPGCLGPRQSRQAWQGGSGARQLRHGGGMLMRMHSISTCLGARACTHLQGEMRQATVPSRALLSGVLPALLKL